MEVLATQRIGAGQEIAWIPPHCVMTKKRLLHTNELIAELEALVLKNTVLRVPATRLHQGRNEAPHRLQIDRPAFLFVAKNRVQQHA